MSNIENDKYKKEIHKIIDNLDNSLNPVDKWECRKRKIKEFSINFSNTNRDQLRNGKRKLRKKLNSLSLNS